MTSLARSTTDRFSVNRSNDAVLAAIHRIRGQNEELNPQAVESQDDNLPFDRRKSRRIQLRMPVIVFPVEDARDCPGTLEVCGGEQIAVTRDLSSQGLGILHDNPLLADEAIVQFDIPGEAPISLLYEVRWSIRKTRYSHMSGGRLTGIVTEEATETISPPM